MVIFICNVLKKEGFTTVSGEQVVVAVLRCLRMLYKATNGLANAYHGHTGLFEKILSTSLTVAGLENAVGTVFTSRRPYHKFPVHFPDCLLQALRMRWAPCSRRAGTCAAAWAVGWRHPWTSALCAGNVDEPSGCSDLDYGHCAATEERRTIKGGLRRTV